MRYPRLGTSFDTPHSELSLYKNYNARYPRLGEYQDWFEYSLVWGISCYNCYKEITQNAEYRDWSKYSLVWGISCYDFL